MKSLLFSFYFIFIAIFVYSENEPNNTMEEANPISINSTLTGDIGGGVSPNIDIDDWWIITIPSNGSLTITTQSGSDVCVVSYLFFSNGSSSITDTYSPPCSVTNRTMSANNLIAGSYYIKCTQYSGVGSYSITTSFTPTSYLNDNEPNDNATNAILIQPIDTLTGNLGYTGLNYLDEEDWFIVTIPLNGSLTVNTHSGTDVCVVSYLLFSNGSSSITDTYSGPCSVTNRTMSATNLIAGTYYIKCTQYSGAGGYSMTTSFTPTSYLNDNEPNDNATNAILIQPIDTLRGNLGYSGLNYLDEEDWYKVIIVEDGALSFHVITTQTLSVDNLYIYDSNSTTLIESGTWGTDAMASYPNLSPRTYFLRIKLYDESGSYQLTSNFTPASYNNDVEPNNFAINAQLIAPNDSLTGRLGYLDGENNDEVDWYRFSVTSDGKIQFRVVTTETLRTDNLYIYDSDSLTLITSGTWGADASANFPDMATGNYFLKIERYEGYGSYYIKSTFTPADYENDLEPNSPAYLAVPIGISDTITGHLGYYGNGIIDDYDWYRFTLTERGKIFFTFNSISNLKCDNLHIFDQDTITKIGNGSWGVTASVESIIELVGTYFLRVPLYENYGSYTLNSEFHPFPKPHFTYIQNLNTCSFTNLTIDGEQYIWRFGDGNSSNLVNPSHTYNAPGEYFTSLIAINSSGRDTLTQQVTVRGVQGINSNRGGNNGVASFFIYGGGLSANATVKLTRTGYPDIIADTITKPDIFSIKPTFNLNGAAVGLWNVVVTVPGYPAYTLENCYTIEQGIEPDFNLSVSGRNKILFNKWQTYTIQYNNAGNTDITGAPFFLLISDIAGLEIEFVSKTIGIPAQPNNIWWQQLIDSTQAYFTIDSIDGAPFAARVYPLFIPNIPANYSGSFTIRIKSPSDFRMVTWVNDPYATGSKLNDYQTCVMWAQATALANGIINIIGTMVPGAQCVSSVSQTLYGLAYSENSLGSGLYAIANAGLSCAFDIGRNLPIIKAWELSYGVYALINDIYSNYSASEECKRKFPKDKPTNNPIQAVSSFDPNEIIGVKGYKEERYTGDQSLYSYQIYFENLASATAPAQEVFVYDTLDMTKFDKHNFSFGSVGFNDTMLFPIPATYEFSIDVDLRPAKDLITRISGIFDTITGIISWSFISLDPLTMDLTEDPMGGFLDPNVTYPEGVGFVSFSIGLNENLSHGTTIENQATILFDLNPQIMTNIWSNTLDFAPPSSSVLPLNNVINDTTFLVSWNGSDNESGILNYSIYVTKNNGNPVEWISKTAQQEAWFTGEYGNTYSFYSIATDSVGNIENSPTMADQTVLLEPSVISIFDPISQIKIYPNPFQHKIFIDLYLNSSETIEVKLYNTLGILVSQFKYNDLNPGKQIIEVKTDLIPDGLYTMKIQGRSFNKAFKIVKTE